VANRVSPRGNLLVREWEEVEAGPEKNLGILGVAWWTLFSLAVHMIQLMQAAWVKMRGGEIISWLESVEG
jgi:hypothetical protein